MIHNVSAGQAMRTGAGILARSVQSSQTGITGSLWIAQQADRQAGVRAAVAGDAVSRSAIKARRHPQCHSVYS